MLPDQVAPIHRYNRYQKEVQLTEEMMAKIKEYGEGQVLLRP